MTKARLGSHAPEPIAARSRKFKHLGRIGHAGDHQPDTEHQTDRKLQHDGHDVHPKCRATNTVAIASAMKLTVATSERGESRASPHTP